MKYLCPTRRWFRFRLRTLFVLVTFVCLYLGWAKNWIQERHAFLERATYYRYADSHEHRAPFPLCMMGEPGLQAVFCEESDLAEAKRLFPE